ncbi:MAG: DUF3710 domain-containing protein [Mycobacteriaceae bacterium]
MALRRRGRKAAHTEPDTATSGIPAASSVAGELEDGADPAEEDAGEEEVEHGPWDSSEVDLDSGDERLDLGSVRLPMPEESQIQVEMDAEGAVHAVHLVTAAGRLTVAAFAAPRSATLWREVAAELAEGLRADGAKVSIGEGPWGREVLGVSPAGAMRFLGVDGPRWMVRCVAAGATETNDELTETAREVLRETVVVRGDEPLPVRTTLPVTLPEELVQQLALAQAQAIAQAQAQAQAMAAEVAQLEAQQEVEPETGPEPT